MVDAVGTTVYGYDAAGQLLNEVVRGQVIP